MKSELIQIKKKIDTDIDKMTQHIFLRYHIIILSFYTCECKFEYNIHSNTAYVGEVWFH